MSKTFKIEENFEFSPAEIISLMLDTSAREAEAIEVGGALEATASAENISPDCVKIIVRSKVYGRGMDGKKDTSRIENAIYEETWDKTKMEAKWNYRMEATFGNNIKIWGTKKLMEKNKTACNYIDEVRVDVDIPVIGGMIAGKVISSLERGRPRFIEWMKKKLHERTHRQL